jgi:putative transcriptional regulator
MRNTLKIFRITASMTQAELGEKIGVTRQTIIAIEAQGYVPSLLIALKIATVFDTSIEKIFELESGD